MESFYLQALIKFITLFEELEKEYGFKYMLVGGVLTPIYAEARQTQDIDILIQLYLSKDTKNKLLKKLKNYQFQPMTSWKDVFLNWKSIQFLQILDPEGIIKLDINIAGLTPKNDSKYEKIKFMAFQHRKRIYFHNIECWIQSKEDFIISKIVYGGYQDYKDALACWIRNNQELNEDYLLKYAKKLKIKDVYDALTKNLPVDEVFSDD